MKVSIVIPLYDMNDGADFLWRCINSILDQTFKDYEIIITREGNTSKNTNAGIKRARGELIKFLHMDDYFTSNDCLEETVNAFTPKDNWLVTGCLGKDDDGMTVKRVLPYYNDKMYMGENTIGAPSVLTIRNRNPLLFNEDLKWLLDCDYYTRLFEKFGEPKVLNDYLVCIGVGRHQATNILTFEEKNKEVEEAIAKHDI